MAPTHCHHWHDLTEDERRAIEDSSDYSIISVIDGLNNKEKQIIYNCIGFDLSKGKEYNILQKRWLEKEREYLAWNTQRHPREVSDIELIKDMNERGTPCRYRLFYTAKRYLEGKFDAFNVNLDNASTQALDTVTDFFEDIREAYNYNPLDNQTIFPKAV
jgi:hypothetical protein